jgi:extradiol dioxygenase family protein
VILGVDHFGIAIPVGSQPLAREFYGDVLGMPETAPPESLVGFGVVWYQFEDGRQLHLLPDTDFRPGTVTHGAFVCDLDALGASLEAQIITVEWDLLLAPRRRFFVFDPFGNRLEFTEPRA